MSLTIHIYNNSSSVHSLNSVPAYIYGGATLLANFHIDFVHAYICLGKHLFMLTPFSPVPIKEQLVTMLGLISLGVGSFAFKVS